jgi:hypothetical protein
MDSGYYNNGGVYRTYYGKVPKHYVIGRGRPRKLDRFLNGTIALKLKDSNHVTLVAKTLSLYLLHAMEKVYQ